TDGPFLSPHPHRGNRNEPAHVRYIVDKISEIKGMPPGIIADQTTANAASLFMWEQEFD
ncbi:MAG: hydrolase TatD, partial [Anaerolineales bacterium]